jgi:hypothetical protein
MCGAFACTTAVPVSTARDVAICRTACSVLLKIIYAFRWNTTRRNLLAENMEHPAHILDEEKKYHRGWLRELASVSA